MVFQSKYWESNVARTVMLAVDQTIYYNTVHPRGVFS